jgi:hypothetical protein
VELSGHSANELTASLANADTFSRDDESRHIQQTVVARDKIETVAKRHCGRDFVVPLDRKVRPGGYEFAVKQWLVLLSVPLYAVSMVIFLAQYAVCSQAYNAMELIFVALILVNVAYSALREYVFQYFEYG